MNGSDRMVLDGWLTRTEFIVLMTLLVLTGIVGLSALPWYLPAKRQSSCQENLKQIGMALRMYASESEGERYPTAKQRDCQGAIQPWSGAVDLEEIVPYYLDAFDTFVCPANPAGRTAVALWDEGKTTNPRWSAVDGFSHNGVVEPCEMLGRPYYYYGWAFSERTFECHVSELPPELKDEIPENYKSYIPVSFAPMHFKEFRVAVLARAKSGEVRGPEASDTWEMRYPNGEPLQLPGMGSTIPSLREGIERLYDRGLDHQLEAERSRIVILHEELPDTNEKSYHENGHINVLYMDGHVEAKSRIAKWWMAKFPLNEAGDILHDAVEETLQLPDPDARLRQEIP